MQGRLKPVLIGVAGAVSALAYGALLRSPSLPVFFGCIGLAALAYLFVYSFLRNEPIPRSCRLQLVAWAMLFRIIGFAGAPLYEDDFYRYLWDGRTFAVQGTPYGQAPSASFGGELPEKFADILGRINYPDIATIYGPVCELVFLVAYWISPGELWALKLLLLLADATLLWMLWRVAGSKANWMLYAWSPLVIKEVAFTAHSDIIVAAFLLGSFCSLQRGRPKTAGGLLACAVAAKITALLFVPILLWKRRAEAGAFVIVLCCLYVPFLVHGATEYSGLKAFAATWEFNSFGFGLLRWLVGWDAAKFLSGVLFAAAYILYLWKWRDISHATVLLGIFFLLSPVVNPWYLLIFVPFAALEPAAWSVAATLTIILAYATGSTLQNSGLGPFDHPSWVRPLEVIPVLFLAGSEWVRFVKRRAKAAVA